MHKSSFYRLCLNKHKKKTIFSFINLAGKHDQHLPFHPMANQTLKPIEY